tara:strand:- start:821 stop:1858 length:1038 start_codon:yes stop_codon:yes gene_type:complete
MFNKDYNFLVKLFHYLVLGNKIVPELLFDIENLLNKKKINNLNIKHQLYITGLARAGTTILLNTIYSSNKFASYTYRDMPFVISPNIWNIVSKRIKSKKSVLRKHKDNILIDLDSPEQFEEVFWNLKDSDKYIFETFLREYEVDKQSLNLYELFIKNCLIKYKSNNYICKNNNNFLRIKSLLKRFPQAKFLVSIRNPLDHSISLLNQHKNFTKLQGEERFTKSYMNYLVHHEFGLSHKPMILDTKFQSDYGLNDINYWLEQWINLYNFAKKNNFNKNNNVLFIFYEELCNHPNSIMAKINNFIGENVFANIKDLNFKLKRYNENDYQFNSTLKKESLEIYNSFVG